MPNELTPRWTLRDVFAMIASIAIPCALAPLVERSDLDLWRRLGLISIFLPLLVSFAGRVERFSRYWMVATFLFVAATLINVFRIGGGWDYSPSGARHSLLSTISFAFGLFAMQAVIFIARNVETPIRGVARVFIWTVFVIACLVVVSDLSLGNSTAHYQFGQHVTSYAIVAICLGLVVLAASLSVAKTR